MPLGIVLLEDRLAFGAWAIGAGWLVLANTRRLRALNAALAAPTPDELREREFEDLIEEMRPLTMTTDPNHIEFATHGFVSRHNGVRQAIEGRVSNRRPSTQRHNLCGGTGTLQPLESEGGLMNVPVGPIPGALLACYLPARRAALVDPAVALRFE